MDVSPKQVVSVAAALIPFLENDDANRALMGSNHAAPGGAADPVRRAAGRHGHGRRWSPATPAPWSSRAGTGIVEQIDGTRIVIRATQETDATKSGVDNLSAEQVPALEPEHLHHQRPLVRVGGQDRRRRHHRRRPVDGSRRIGPGPQRPRRFMPWNGYNFEDSILISVRIVRDDVFTSIHIEEFEVMAPGHQARSRGNHPRHPQRR